MERGRIATFLSFLPKKIPAEHLHISDTSDSNVGFWGLDRFLTLVHAKNDDVRGLSNPPSALLTSLRLTVPRVLHLSLGSREENRVVNFEAHALRRHEHAAFADQRLEPPQLSQTLSASPRAAAIDRAASTVPETHGSAGSHAELSPAVGARPRLTLVHAEHSLTVLMWHSMRKRPPEELAGSGRSTRARRS